MSIAKEFREFAVKGNVVDMAVGIIIGAAFGKIVSSLVSDVVTPPLGYVIGGVDFTKLAITLPNSREGESEADAVGTQLAAHAGYDPKAAVTLWEKMAKLGKGPAEFLSTHPSPQNRAAKLRELGFRGKFVSPLPSPRIL